MSENLTPLPKDPPVARLAELLDLPYYAALGIRSTLRFLAEERYPIGDFRDLTASELASMIGWKDDAESLFAALLECDILKQDEGGYFMADWVDGDPKWFGFSKWLRKGMQEEEEGE